MDGTPVMHVLEDNRTMEMTCTACSEIKVSKTFDSLDLSKNGTWYAQMLRAYIVGHGGLALNTYGGPLCPNCTNPKDLSSYLLTTSYYYCQEHDKMSTEMCFRTELTKHY